MRLMFLTAMIALISAAPLAAEVDEYDLGEAIQAIKELPSSAAFYQSVERSGAVQFVMKPLDDCSFDALWDGGDRIIYINSNQVNTKGKIISSILFELHNASTNDQLKELVDNAERGYINKEQYVRGVETLEYHNVIHTEQLLKEGVDQKIFPDDCMISAFRNFEDHFKLQQIHGHSQWLADQYDQFFPHIRKQKFKGTLPNADHLKTEEKFTLVRYLVMKDGLYSDKRDVASESLHRLVIELHLKEAPKLLRVAFS